MQLGERTLKELRVVAVDNIWCAAHLEDDQPDEEIMDLFDGDHVLPTPFFTSVPVKVVVDELRRLNPKSRVFYPMCGVHEQFALWGFCPRCLGGQAKCVRCGAIIHPMGCKAD